MSRPTLEVADIVRAVGNRFWEKHKSHLAWLHRKVLDAILRCRTAALGGHLDKCLNCGHQAISYNSCTGQPDGDNRYMTSLPSRRGRGGLFLELTALISTATYPFGCVSSYPLWRIGVGAASLRFE